MSKLVEKLKADHAALVKTFEEIKALGIKNPEAIKKINSAKAALLGHLKLEETQLYPVLHKAADKDIKLKSTLNVLAQNMEQIAKDALSFFAKYEKGGDELEFAKDFVKLHFALATRIRREEETLYAEFDKVS